MAYNGAGTFERLYSWVTDKANGIKVLASRMDDEMNGFATGLSNCITKDGQTTISANIPFNSKKITGLTNGSARTDSIALGQVQDNTYEYLGENGGSADAYTWAPSPAIPAYTAGQKWIVVIGSGDDNTGASTADISSLGTRSIVKSDGAGGTIALVANDMVAGGIYMLIDTGTALLLDNPEIPNLDGSNITKVGTLTAGNVDAAVSAAGDATAGKIETATQAEQEAASSTSVAVTPGRQHSHPSAAKAWVSFDNNGTIKASYNTTSITRNGTGDFTWTFDTDFSSADYVVTGSGQRNNATGRGIEIVCDSGGTYTQTAGTFRFKTMVHDSATQEDPLRMWLVAYGDQ